MKWRQRINPDGTSTFVPVGEGHEAPDDPSFAIHGDLQSFVSPIDGTVIADRGQYREHCRKHDVVPSEEFSAEHFRRAAENRARVFTGNLTNKESLARKKEMYELATRMERENEGRRRN